MSFLSCPCFELQILCIDSYTPYYNYKKDFLFTFCNELKDNCMDSRELNSFSLLKCTTQWRGASVECRWSVWLSVHLWFKSREGETLTADERWSWSLTLCVFIQGKRFWPTYWRTRVMIVSVDSAGRWLHSIAPYFPYTSPPCSVST